MHFIVLLSVAISVVKCAQIPIPVQNDNLHNGLSERIGNFSIEVLYHTSKTLEEGQNFIMSPITMWNVLAVVAEGAYGPTRSEIRNAIRWNTKQSNATRNGFKNITSLLKVNTDTVQLAKINTMFVDTNRLPLRDFQDTAKSEYETEVLPLDFKDNVNAANAINRAISNVTHGLIERIVEPDYFENTAMVMTSALYFKGQWTVPFNSSSTSKMPFYDSKGNKIGEVNMMYNRFTYPFSNMRGLQARVIEIPYGKQNRLSMLIMLPNPGVSVEDMFKNFQTVDLDSFFEELRVSKEEYSEDEVDCFIPRFKIESNLDMTDVLKTRFGIERLFDPAQASLPYIARTPLHVSKIVHKAKIEVTEEGTEAAGVTAAEFSNRIGAVQFQANRPFTYVIVEKVTNSIVFGGFYKTPSLY
ncbi:serine protease inhibitor 77Ba-like [Anticarsia gemmatalis]|uniref:serine protease inhibitor 77Ba-like n=1 Tax=Anticarsia gemmatalis TaxID=129554 RepID=UPI003F7753D1